MSSGSSRRRTTGTHPAWTEKAPLLAAQVLVRMLKFLQPAVRQPGPRQAADSASRSPSSLMRPVTLCYVWETIGTVWYSMYTPVEDVTQTARFYCDYVRPIRFEEKLLRSALNSCVQGLAVAGCCLFAAANAAKPAADGGQNTRTTLATKPLL